MECKEKLQGNESTITDTDFNTPLSEIDKSMKQKISKDIKKQKGIIQLYLICMHNILHGMFVEISS